MKKRKKKKGKYETLERIILATATLELLTAILQLVEELTD